MSKKNKKRKKTSSETAIQESLKTNLIPVYKGLSLKLKLSILGLFVLIASLQYSESLNFGYVLDDQMVITENSYTKDGINGIRKIFTTDSFKGYFGEQMNLVEGGRYRPLSIASFAIEHELYGLNPTLSHAINIFLYALSAFLLFLYVKRLLLVNPDTKRILYTISFMAALLFLVHPVHTEAVANIKGRDEILSFIFSFLAAHFSLKFIDSKKLYYLILMGCSFFLGILAKETTLTFLAIIPAGIFFLRPGNFKKLFLVFSSLLALTTVYLFIRYQIMGYLISSSPITDVMNNPFAEMSVSEKYATIFYTLLKYLGLNLIPYPLTHDYYPYHIPIMSWSKILVWLGLLSHALMVYLIYAFRKTAPIVSFGFTLYLFALSIVSNMFVSVGTFMNERFIYSASAGMCIVIAYLIKKLMDERSEKIGLGLLAVVVLAFGILSFLRVPAWESEFALNNAAIKISKNSARANSFMSTALFNLYKTENDREKKRALLNEALPYAKKAIEIIPHYSNANLMYAGIAAEEYKMNGNLNELLKSFKEVIIRKPEIGFITEFLKYLNGREDARSLIDFYYDVAYRDLIVKKKNYRWGVHFLNLGYQLDSDNRDINSGLYQAYMALGNEAEARKYLK